MTLDEIRWSEWEQEYIRGEVISFRYACCACCQSPKLKLVVHANGKWTVFYALPRKEYLAWYTAKSDLSDNAKQAETLIGAKRASTTTALAWLKERGE